MWLEVQQNVGNCKHVKVLGVRLLHCVCVCSLYVSGRKYWNQHVKVLGVRLQHFVCVCVCVCVPYM